jgi:hypothetical protein
VCESPDGYKNCILYKAIIENKPICPVINKCTEHFQKLTVKVILKLMKSDKILKTFNLDEYCFSNNYINCARYKCIEDGKKPPNSLRPDGTETKLKELLLKAID